MKENYYIQAAIQLGEIEDTFGYGVENGKIILTDASELDISDAVDSRAQHLANLANVRDNRNRKLADTDWIANPDVPESDLKTAMMRYRQALRDVTDQVVEGQEVNINWPEDPRVS